MRNLCLAAAIVASLAGLRVFAADRTPAPPHLLLNPSDFPRLNELARAQPWAKKQRDKIIADAAAFPGSYEKKYGLRSMELPPEGGQWAHLYVSPDTGTELHFRPPNHNVCLETGKEYPGAPYDQVVYQDRAFALGEGALTSGLAYRLTGNRADAMKGAAVLKAYADRYKSYPIHAIWGRKPSKADGRVFCQSLDEAEWLIKIAWAYDLLRDSDAFTPAERAHVENDLISAAAGVVANGSGTLNINSWMNAGVAAAGYTLNNQALVDHALNGKKGFHAQMKDNVVDGFWLEGALGYQYYAIEPLELTAQMSTRAGTNLWRQEPNLEALFLSPLGELFPDGTTPAFNDATGGHKILEQRAYVYEAAYSATLNPIFAAICADSKRDDREAFLFGVPSIDTGSLPHPKSAVFPAAGLATLRAPAGDLTEIMKFGPQGGVHGHFDKLNEVIYAKGMVMSVDPGSQRYGIATHYTWDRMTVAHNTVGVDETAQAPATGKLLAWQSQPEFTAVSADAGPVYPNADLQRTSLLTSDYILEISIGRSTDGKEHDFDLSYHNYGVEHPDGEFAPYSGFPQRDGYQILTANQVAHLAGDFHTNFAMEDGKSMDVWVLGDGKTDEVFTGLGLGPQLVHKIPYFIVRHHDLATKFIAIMQPGPAPAKIVSVTSADGSIKIKSSKWEDTIQLGAPISYRRDLLAASQPLPRSTPEAEGVSSAAVETLVRTLDQQVPAMHSIMVVRHGAVIAEGWWAPHSPEERHVMYSLSKSVTSAAVGMAIAEGRLNLDDPVVKFFPGDLPAEPSAHLRAMRIRDVLTMTSGHETEPKLSRINAPWLKSYFAHPVPAAPGTYFLYDSSNTYLLSAIVQKVTGQTLLEYLRPRLFDPLGIDSPTWESSPEGVNLGYSGLRLRTEDVAKFGQLYLQKGRWQGKQLIPAAWAEASTTKQVPNDSGPGARKDIDSRQGYGFNFWMARSGAYRASGSNGQFSIVLPQQDTVVAITADLKVMEKLMPVVLKLLLPSLRAAPLPANPAALDRLKQTLSTLADPAQAAKPDPLAPWRSGVKVHAVSDAPGRHTIHSYYLTSPESPDGSSVLFYVSTTPEGEHGELIVRNRSTGDEKVIAENIDTEDAHRVARQQWISNGKRVSYDDVKNGQWSIHVVDLDTLANRKLAEDHQCGFGRVVDDLIPICGCHWKPGAYRSLELLNVATGEIQASIPIASVESHYPAWLNQEFKGKPTSIYEPVISPDGKRVLVKLATPGPAGAENNFKTEEASHREGMVVYDLATQEPIFLQKKWGHPAWFPDSSKILDVKSIYYDVDQKGKPITVTGIPFLRGEHESVSPDGKLYVKDGSLASLGGGTDWGVMVCDVTGNNFQVIARFDNSKGATTWRHNHPHPAFSPDGKRIYFNENSGPFTQLFVAECGSAFN